jgi:hypothetical protein
MINNERQPKMYILVKKSIPSHKAVSIAHASLMCYLKFQADSSVQEWLKNSFQKVICEVSDPEFTGAKCIGLDHVVVTEPNLKGVETAIAFKPRLDWPSEFKYYTLMRV